jgi:hypothetical protein
LTATVFLSVLAATTTWVSKGIVAPVLDRHPGEMFAAEEQAGIVET